MTVVHDVAQALLRAGSASRRGADALAGAPLEHQGGDVAIGPEGE